MGHLRKITAIVADEAGNNIRKSSDERAYIVVDCEASIEDNVLLPEVRKAFFAKEELLDKVSAGMSILVD